MSLTAEFLASPAAVEPSVSLPPEPEEPLAQPGVISHALLESRQRWRQFGTIATDLVFETDAAGVLTFFGPDDALGWRAAALLGQPAQALLQDAAGADPFLFTTPQLRRPTWLRACGKEPQCMALTVVPMRDEVGRHRGVRGVGVNVTAQQVAVSATAASLRRSDVLDHILTEMRHEVMAPKIMQSVLHRLMRALGAEGAVVLDLGQAEQPGAVAVLHGAGLEAEDMIDQLRPVLAAVPDVIRSSHLLDGTPTLLACCSTRFGDRAALVSWRAPKARDWDADDEVLIGSVAGIVRIILEHESIQRELARQARTDPLTGLLNRRAFMEEARRRLDRLEREGLPGTLLFLDMDGLKQLNDHQGHEIGDAALLIISSLLHRTFRPADLVARLGGDEFAIWMDGADSLTAAERAESLRLLAPAEMAHLARSASDAPGLSTGIATREPGSDETLENLIQRADQAMYHVKRCGRGHWRVSNAGALT